MTVPDPVVRDDGEVDTSWPSAPDRGRAFGAVVRSTWENGWPFGTLDYSRDRLVLRGLVYRRAVTRNELSVIDVERVRLPFAWRTMLWFDGIEPPIAFVPYRTAALLRELERLDWPVFRRT